MTDHAVTDHAVDLQRSAGVRRTKLFPHEPSAGVGRLVQAEAPSFASLLAQP